MSKPDSQAPSSEDPAATIREQARKVRQSRHEIDEEPASDAIDESSQEFHVEVEESKTNMRRAARGPSAWDRAKPHAIKLLLTALGGLAGTGGGVALEKSRPPPSVVEMNKLRTELDAEKAARERLDAELREKIASAKSDGKESYKDLRELMFDQVNKPLNSRLNSLEAWQAEQIREQERTRRTVR